MSFKLIIALSLLASSLGGCSYFDRLRDVGGGPNLSAIKNPVIQPGYRPVSMPMPVAEPASFSPNSLWRNGARAFFKDQRAARVGDILTVIVEITDKAEIDNASNRKRNNAEKSAASKLMGLEQSLKKYLPKAFDFSSIVDLSSTANSDGSGTIDREEKIKTKMAAVVTQVLPNGNMVIEGHQEVRVNHELRELIVAGVVRPQDISSENTIPISKIAEARVSYGGKGQLSDVQTPRYGQQVLDIVLPF